MSEDYNPYNRVDRFKKRRNNTKAITIFGIAGLVFVVILIGVFVFGGKDDDKLAESSSSSNDDIQEQVNETSDQNDDGELSTEEPVEEASTTEDPTENDQSSEESTSESDEQYELVKETVSSEDENVIEAYTANWKPIGTSQVGEHEINWNELKDTQDWPEILSASSLATNVYVDDMIGWWVEGNGEDKVITTISNKAQTETYRVYLTWVDREGWMPTKVEVLKENDKKSNFDNDTDESAEETDSVETPADDQEASADNSTDLEVVTD